MTVELKTGTVTRKQFETLKAELDQSDADVKMLGQSYAELGATKRAQVNALTRTLKLRTRWIIALAIVSAAQTIAIFATAI
jgi:hypothetical protein